MNITLHIEAANPAELQEAIAGLAGITNSPVVAPKSEPEKTKRTSRVTADPDKQPDPKQNVESDAPKETVEETPDLGTEEIPTIVELRAKAQEKGTTAEGKKAIKALLDEFECKSISNVPDEVRAAFMQKLEAL